MSGVSDTNSKAQTPLAAKNAQGSDAPTDVKPKSTDATQVGTKLLLDTPYMSKPQGAKPSDVKLATATAYGGYPYPAMTIVSESLASNNATNNDRSVAGDKKSIDQNILSQQKQALITIEASMQKYLKYFAAGAGLDGQLDEKAIAVAAQQLADDKGQFGQDARALYGKYVDWLQRADGPALLRQLENKGLPLPPGLPAVVSDSMAALNKDKSSLSPADVIRQLSLASDVRFDLKVDPTKEPGSDELFKLQSSLDWMTKASNALLKADQQIADSQMVLNLRSFGFSSAFMAPGGMDARHYRPGQSAPEYVLERWRQNTQLTLDLAHEMRRYSEATLSLSNAGYYSKLKMPLPPGVTENPPGKLNYDFPTDPRMDTPENQARLKAFADWKQQYGQVVDKTLIDVEMAKLRPDQMLMWGDIELQNEVGVFKNGVFQSLAKRNGYTARAGETVQDVNLMQNRFDVRSERDASGKETIVVSQSVQAEQVAPWGYQNLIGVEDVGQPYKPAEQRYKPEDFVPISTPDGMKLIQARDLGSYKFGQQFDLYGGKALIATMDGAMLVSSVIGVGEVGLGARALIAGGELAARVTAEDLAMHGAEMGLRLTVAAAGIFNNAGAKDTSWGRTINQIRGYYFMADIALGAGLLPSVKGVVGAEAAGQQRIDEFMRLQMDKSPLLSAINTGTKWTFKVTEFGMVPPVVKDNITELQHIFGEHQNDNLADAWRFLNHGPGLQAAKAGDFDPKNTDVLKATDDVLSGYEAVLSRGRSDTTKSQVQDILDKTKAVLLLQSSGDPKAVEAKANLLSELITQEQLHAQDILALNTYIRNNDPSDGGMAGRPLSAADLNDLYTGKIPAWVDIERGSHMLAMVKDMMAHRDQDVAAARRIALLYLARDKDGKLPQSLGAVTINMPLGRENSDWNNVFDQTAQGQISIATADVIANLKAHLGASNGLAVGDVLTRVGAITYQQYAGVLEDVLGSPTASKEDKLQALLGGQGVDFATLATALRVGSSSLDSFGANAKDLEKTLDKLSANVKEDPDVRGLASILRFGLTPENASVLPAIVAAARKALLPDGTVKPGTLASSAVQYLQYRALHTPDGVAADDSEYKTRLAAAHSLRLLGSDRPDLALSAARGFAYLALNSPSPELQARAFDELIKNHTSNKSCDLDLLNKADPDLATKILAKYVSSTEESVSSVLSDDSSNSASARRLLEAVGIMDKLSPEQKKTLAASLRQQYLDTLVGQSTAHIDIKVAALQAMAKLDPSGSLTTLVTAAGGGDRSDSEPNAAVRQTALSILNQLCYANMSTLLSELAKTEGDAAVKKTIADLQYMYGRNLLDSVDGTPGRSIDFIAAEQAASGPARQILESTQAVLELAEKGDAKAAEAKKNLIAQLISQEQFTTDQILQMNRYLRQIDPLKGNLYGRALSGSDLGDLYAGKPPSWFATESIDPLKAKHLVDMAEAFIDKDPDVAVARRVSLLALLRQDGGSLPETVGSTEVDFPYPSMPGLADQTYSQTIAVNTDALVKRLQSELARESPLTLALKELVEPILPKAKTAGDQAEENLTQNQISWLQDRFPLLMSRDYESQAIQAGDNSMSRWSKIFSSSETIEKTGMTAIEVLAEERQKQWNTLVQLAMSSASDEQNTVEDISSAKAILFSVLCNQGKPLGTAGSGAINWGTHQVTGADPLDPLLNPGDQWQIKAAKALALASQPGVVGRDQVESYIKDALVGGDNIPPEALMILLQAWRQYYSPLRQLATHPSDGSTFLSMADYEQVIQAAYRAEQQRQKRGMGTDVYSQALESAISEIA